MTGIVGTSRCFIGRVATLLAAFTLILAVDAGKGVHAHTVRYIASNGNDANGCGRTTPCLTLQRGIDRTAAGSELIILDSGDFGDGATIDKSITVSAIGVSATIGGKITINGADATVVLRGLRLNGAGAAVIGIDILAAAAVHIVDCEVHNFGSTGISFRANTDLFVSNTVVRNNSFGGLSFLPGAGGALSVDNSRFERNGIGSSYDGITINSGKAKISRTIISGNSGEGIHQFGGETNIVFTTAGHNGGSGYRVQGGGRMTVEQSVARGNAYGLRASQSNTVVVLAGSVVTNNSTGISVSGAAALLTRGSSTVAGNTTDVSGMLTPLAGL